MKGVFLPDEESIRELFGPWLDKGLNVYTQFDEVHGWCLKVKFRPPSNGIPVWQLDAKQLTSAKKAERYFTKLRDTEMVKVCGPLLPAQPNP